MQGVAKLIAYVSILKPRGIYRGVNTMRMDKYLKVSRLIKRRTLAAEACEKGRIIINGKVAKPSSEIKTGDIIEIQFGTSTTKVEVTSVSEHVTKDGAKEMYEIK